MIQIPSLSAISKQDIKDWEWEVFEYHRQDLTVRFRSVEKEVKPEIMQRGPGQAHPLSHFDIVYITSSCRFLNCVNQYSTNVYVSVKNVQTSVSGYRVRWVWLSAKHPLSLKWSSKSMLVLKGLTLGEFLQGFIMCMIILVIVL